MTYAHKAKAATNGYKELNWELQLREVESASGLYNPTNLGGQGGSPAVSYGDNFRQVTGYFPLLDFHLLIYKMGVTMPISSLLGGRLN